MNDFYVCLVDGIKLLDDTGDYKRFSSVKEIKEYVKTYKTLMIYRCDENKNIIGVLKV